MTSKAGGGKSPEHFLFLPCIYFVLTTTGEGSHGQGYFSITRKEMQKQTLACILVLLELSKEISFQRNQSETSDLPAH